MSRHRGFFAKSQVSKEYKLLINKSLFSTHHRVMHTVDQFARYLLVTQRVQSDPENNILNMRESKQQYNFLYIKRLIHGLFAFPPEVCL
jgi:hypothetical protein